MTDEELFSYRMNPDEQAAWKKIQAQIIEDCAKAAVPKGYTAFIRSEIGNNAEMHFGCCEGEGYYSVFCERGSCMLIFKGSEKEMRFHLLSTVLRRIGQKIELKNRDELAKEWRMYKKITGTRADAGRTIAVHSEIIHTDYIYSTEYDSRKFWMEYEINGIRAVLGDESAHKCIDYCTGCMNIAFGCEHWRYDSRTGRFIEK